MSTIKNLLAQVGLPLPKIRAKYMYSEYLRGPWIPFIPLENDFERHIQLPKFWGTHKRNYFGPPQFTNILTKEGIQQAYSILLPDGTIWDSHEREFLENPKFPAWDYREDFWIAHNNNS